MFSPTLLRIFALRQYSDHITIYNPDCTPYKLIRPKSPQLRNMIIYDIFFCETQQRLAASFKDSWICFWDSSDNFNYEKVFSTSQVSQFNTDQIKIHFLEHIKTWITIDQEQNIHFWDLEIEQISYSIENRINIIEIIDIPYMQLTCLVSAHHLHLWDMTTPKMLFAINVNHKRLHQVVFFKSYQVILTSGYDNFINVYQLHKRYNDAELLGRLDGHSSLVTSVACIEGSPIAITSDDKYNIKLWDIRVLKCVQSFDLELRQPIGRITVLDGVQAVCLVTNRILVIEFENCVSRNVSKPPIEAPSVPVKIEYDPTKLRLICCTKSDLRIINLLNGRIQLIIKGIITSSDDEITAFASITIFNQMYKALQQHKKAILGTLKGVVKIYECESGELIEEFQAHQNEISNIIIDYENQIIVTTSYDSQILIWKETQKIMNVQKEFKYENLREIKNSHYQGQILQTEISFYHNLIATSSNNSILYLWNFEFGKLVASIKLEDHLEPTTIKFINGYNVLIISDNQGSLYFVEISANDDNVRISLMKKIQSENIFTKILVNFISQKEIFLFAATDQGSVKLFDLSLLITEKQFLVHCSQRINFNPNRQSREDFLQSINAPNITHYMMKIEKEHVWLNYPKIEIKAHHDQLTQIGFISLEGENLLQSGENKKIITSSTDQFIKIWTATKLELLCVLNINHPLPIKWDIQINEKEIIKFKITFALKIVHFIRKNQSSQLSISHARMLEPTNLLKKIMVQINKKQKVPKTNSDHVLLLSDEYSPRDLHFDKVKNQYKLELQGMSLKQLEEQKKIFLYAQMWKKQQEESEKQTSNLNRKNQIVQDDKQKELKQVLQFLNQNFRKRLLEEQLDLPEILSPSGLVQNLELKLNNMKSLTEEDAVQERLSKRISQKTQLRRSNFSILTNQNSKIFTVLEGEKSSLEQSRQFSHRKHVSSEISKTERKFNSTKLKSSEAGQSDFFQYANDRNLFKNKLPTEIPGALVSDFSNNQKQKVINKIGVNLMRKTSESLFKKIVVNLEQKLKTSKHSFKTTTDFYNNIKPKISSFNSTQISGETKVFISQ